MVTSIWVDKHARINNQNAKVQASVGDRGGATSYSFCAEPKMVPRGGVTLVLDIIGLKTVAA
jgi:hypothetical protein